jgi:hypothetical protein
LSLDVIREDPYFATISWENLHNTFIPHTGLWQVGKVCILSILIKYKDELTEGVDLNEILKKKLKLDTQKMSSSCADTLDTKVLPYEVMNLGGFTYAI